MSTRFHRCRTSTIAILLLALLIPRCLMAADTVFVGTNTAGHSPCHAMQGPADPGKAAAQLTCAQQCEQSLVSTYSEKLDFKFQDHAFVALLSTHAPVFLSLASTELHHGWPPDNQLLLASTADLYLTTNRLRL